jgi:hypothetical protein
MYSVDFSSSGMKYARNPLLVASIQNKRGCASFSHARAFPLNDAHVTPPAAAPVCLGATSNHLLDAQTFER